MIQLKFLKAQNGDCFLLSFNDKNENPRNILIDGGRSATYYDSITNPNGGLRKELKEIRDRNEYIDLLVLTHIDNDHIEGLLKWFEIDPKAVEMIGNIWFNSGKLIAQSLNQPENIDLRVGLKIFKTAFTGVNEAIEFEDYLLQNTKWDRKIVMKGEVLEEFGVKIQVLSPDKNQLCKLLKQYKAVTGDSAYTAGREKDWVKTFSSFIDEESNDDFKFRQDTSVKNGSSISFIITIEDKSFLFLGDSHPNGIVNALKELGYNKENPLIVEAMKVSHHGSKNNTSTELLSLIETDNYLISTDSTGHGHPNKRTLARIINRNSNAILHFNYTNVKDYMLQKQDCEDFPNIKIMLTTKLEF
jgi:metal-dependent hydrolase (beta-lactamase superfamily II)